MPVLAGKPRYCPKGQSYFRHIGLFYYISLTRISLFSNSFDFTALKGRFGLDPFDEVASRFRDQKLA